MSHDKNGTTGLNHMNNRQLAEGLEFLDDLTEDERKRFEALPDEDKHRFLISLCRSANSYIFTCREINYLTDETIKTNREQPTFTGCSLFVYP